MNTPMTSTPNSGGRDTPTPRIDAYSCTYLFLPYKSILISLSLQSLITQSPLPL